MLHLYDFMGVTGPQQFFTFVTGPLLEIIEQPWSSGQCLSMAAVRVFVLLSPFRLTQLVEITLLIGVLSRYLFKRFRFRVYVQGVCLSFGTEFTFRFRDQVLSLDFRFSFQVQVLSLDFRFSFQVQVLSLGSPWVQVWVVSVLGLGFGFSFGFRFRIWVQVLGVGFAFMFRILGHITRNLR